MCQAFQRTAAAHSGRPALRVLDTSSGISWGDYASKVRQAAAALAAAGLGRGQPLALMLSNRPEFHIIDAAAMHLGATPFSVYNTSSADQLAHIVGDSGCRIAVTERALLPVVSAARSQAGASISRVIVVDGPQTGADDWTDVLAAADPQFDFDAAWRAVEPDDILTLIYTSGTTGPPKGVQISHRNARAMCTMLLPFVGLRHGARLVSGWPMAHVAERMCTQYFPMALALDVTCVRDPREIAASLPSVRPQFFFAPPRLWEKLRASVLAQIAHEPDPTRKRSIETAVESGVRRGREHGAGEVGAPDADGVLHSLRSQLGLDELEVGLTGAAPCPVEVIELLRAIGVPLVEIYGLSETTGVATANPPNRVKIGSIGVPLPGVEVRLAGDGEVLIRGDLVMSGYRNLPDKTAEAIDPDGWLHSGDIGEVDDDGYYRIVDRKKELIINAAGKNMSPANIEARLKVCSPLVAQACVIGDAMPYNVALLTLDPDGAAVFATQHGLADLPGAALASHPRVVSEVAAGVHRANAALSRVEQIKKFELLPSDWQPDGEELTPTMKLKRRNIASKYADIIEILYAR
jgi:long-chain acyl-CoA synthetase